MINPTLHQILNSHKEVVFFNHDNTAYTILFKDDNAGFGEMLQTDNNTLYTFVSGTLNQFEIDLNYADWEPLDNFWSSSKKISKECSCPLNAIMSIGCICGAIEPYKAILY